jgi:hypothetical protein
VYCHPVRLYIQKVECRAKGRGHCPGHKFSLVFFHQLCECRVPFLCHANRAFNGHIDGQRSHVRKEMIHLPRFFPLPALAICNGYDVGS